MAKLHPQFKLWIASGEPESGFGEGKWRLLCAIQEHGTLKAATDSLGISYRKAWNDLRRAEEVLGVPLTEKRRGGDGGGETSLTQAGKDWLVAYGRLRQTVQAALAREFKAQMRRQGL